MRSRKKTYPDPAETRAKAHQAVAVINQLAALSIAVIKINMAGISPVFDVEHCPYCHQLRNEPIGKGVDELGRYVLRQAVSNGCLILWRERL